MTSEDKPIEVDEVLESFMLEEVIDLATLNRYVNEYPQFATELIDLSREVSCMKGKPDYELTESDELLVREAWAAYSSTTPAAKADPLALLQPKELNKLASALQLPRQVLAALRERRVIVASMSAKFLDSLAKELACSVSALIEILSSSTAAEPAGSHKSDVKPQVAEKVDFARVLQDAGVDSSRVADLVASGGDNGRN
jgi:DNA-binding Xre family transcriptional regulator